MIVQVNYLQANHSTKKYIFYKKKQKAKNTIEILLAISCQYANRVSRSFHS